MAGAVKPSAVACSTGLNAFLPDANAGMVTHVSQFVRPPAMHGEPVVVRCLFSRADEASIRRVGFAYNDRREAPRGYE